MEYDHLHEIIEEIEKSPGEILKSSKYTVSTASAYKKIVRTIIFDFMEECRNNLSEAGPDNGIRLFQDLRKKIEMTSEELFERNADGKLSYRFPEASFGKIELELIEVKKYLVNQSILHLTSRIIELRGIVRTPSKSNPSLQLSKSLANAAYVSYFQNREDLEECFVIFQDQKLIDNETDYNDFLRVFTGNQPSSKISWHGTNQELSYLIKSLDGKHIEPLRKHIWTTTINCFKDPKGNDYTVHKLRHSGDPKDKSRIKPVIDFFNKYSRNH